MDQTAYFEQMRQKRRAEILEEARQMILAEGPMTFTMQNLSKRLDISNVTLYKYFKNSEDLLRTLYLETSQKYGGYSGSRISEETPLEAFLQNIRFSLDEYLECRKDMALLTTLSLFGRTFGEASENLFGETFCKKEITLLAEAQRQGQVRDDLPVEEVFRFFSGPLFLLSAPHRPDDGARIPGAKGNDFLAEKGIARHDPRLPDRTSGRSTPVKKTPARH